MYTLTISNDVGLAAYVKMNGGILVRTINSNGKKGFVFEFEEGTTENGDRSVEDWRLKYLNTCCRRHDTEVLTLKRLIR